MIRKLNRTLSTIPDAPVALMLRVFPALVFWQSGQTKVEGFSIKDSTWFLFEHEYALPVIPYEVAAVLATIAEHLLPVLLILGLFTRLSAHGLVIVSCGGDRNGNRRRRAERGFSAGLASLQESKPSSGCRKSPLRNCGV